MTKVVRTMSKYNSKKIEIDGYTFDSKKESKRYLFLKDLENLGQIEDLRLQVKYVLIPAQREPMYVTPRGKIKLGNVIERECAYIADFVYKENGKEVVEDVKGYRRGPAYSLYTIKRKLMLEKYGVRIREV